MATSVASRNPSPTAARRPRPPPPQRVQSTQYAAPTLSRLTTKTRSSSASRLYSQDYLSPTSPSTTPLGSINDSASLLVDKKTSAHLGKDGKDSIKNRVKGKGKGKAVAFVVGIPSAGEEGDLDVDQSEREGMVTPGRDGAFVNGCDGYSLPPQRHSDPTIDEIIRSQIRQPIHSVDSLDLDSLLPLGISDYSFVLQPPSSAKSSSSNVAQSGTPPADEANSIVDRPDRVSMGKGKFSEVLLVRKGDAEFALKHTPLHPHHPLIANRLLREPTILAQLLPHPNLVKVFETIRTGGHFYLVEESLRSSITLEAFVTSFPGGVLPLPVAWSVLEQLSSVVRSLHEPLRVVHRDIKPENILVRVTPPSPSSPPDIPPTVALKLLDFGLATHFSASEPKLTTCCGSPAYHSPELWKGLREPSGTVPYWGPEIDIWCCGLRFPDSISGKFIPRYIGPFPIIDADHSKSTYVLTFPPHLRLHPRIPASKLRPHFDNDDSRFPSRSLSQPGPALSASDAAQEEWYVEKIVGDRMKNGKKQYKVRYEGYSAGDDQWRPGSEIESTAPDALEEYLQAQTVSARRLPGRRSKKVAAFFSSIPSLLSKPLVSSLGGVGARIT